MNDVKDNREKDPGAVRLGRLGGLAKPTKPKGFAAMTPDRRRQAGKRGGIAQARNKKQA